MQLGLLIAHDAVQSPQEALPVQVGGCVGTPEKPHHWHAATDCLYGSSIQLCVTYVNRASWTFCADLNAVGLVLFHSLALPAHQTD